MQLILCAQAGRAELLQRLGVQLNQWAPLLQRFIKSEDEQVCSINTGVCLVLHAADECQ